MPRSKKSQSKHDSEVRKTAKELKAKGFDVHADISGFPKPETIHGFRPDVIAKKGRKKIVVEVETPDSVKSARDLKQQKAFRAQANGNQNTTFKRKIARGCP